MTSQQSPLAPVRKQVRVACDVNQAFRTFTQDIGAWWPVQTHSISAGEDGSHPPQAVVFETSVGGHLYETAHDGRRCDWGTIVAFEPPRRIVLEWTVNPARPATEVEVTFTADGEGTLVTLEHRGWDRDTEEGVAWRSGYESGWVTVLGRYQEAADS